MELLDRVERVGGEHVIDDPDPLVVRERQVDVRVRDEVDRERVAGRAADGEPEPALAGRYGDEGRREDRPRPALRVAVEAPRPLPRLQMRRCGLQELVGGVAGARGHEVDEPARVASERRPVEVVVRDEALMLLAAAAVEADAVDGRVRRAGEPLEQPER